jgi:hypothetical protein
MAAMRSQNYAVRPNIHTDTHTDKHRHTHTDTHRHRHRHNQHTHRHTDTHDFMSNAADSKTLALSAELCVRSDRNLNSHNCMPTCLPENHTARPRRRAPPKDRPTDVSAQHHKPATTGCWVEHTAPRLLQLSRSCLQCRQSWRTSCVDFESPVLVCVPRTIFHRQTCQTQWRVGCNASRVRAGSERLILKHPCMLATCV